MKFTITNADLQNALAAAVAVSKHPDPIRIIAERIGEDPGAVDTEERPAETGQVRLVAFSDTMVIEWRRPAEIRMAGTAAVVPEGLDRLVKASKTSDSTFTLETVDTDNAAALRLTTARSSHEFPTVSGSVFDTVQVGHTDSPRSDLSNLGRAIEIARIAAASRGDAAGGRIMLTGVHLRIREGLVDVVGTDGRRMAVIQLRNTDIGGLDLTAHPGGITLPPEALGLVTEMLKSPEASFEVIGHNAVVETASGSLSVRLIDAAYPDYTSLLAAKVPGRISLAKPALDIALQRSSVALARDKRAVAVKLTRDEEGVYMTSSAAGQSSSECLTEEGGDAFEIGFDVRYMQQAIGVFEGGAIDLAFDAETAPIRVTSQKRPEVQMLVMPCRVG